MTFSLKNFALVAALGLAFIFTLSCGEHTLEEIFGLDSSSSEEEEELPRSSSSPLGTSNGSGLRQSSSSSQLGSSSSSGLQQSSSSSQLDTSSSSGLQQSSSSSQLGTSSSSSQLGTSSSSSRQQSSNSGTLTDTRDGKTYKTVKIGDQVWMAENLNIETGNSVCYNNDQANCTKYGRLYDWKTAKNACPSGWHLPSNAEWEELLRYVDGTSGTASPYKSETAGKNLKTSGTNNFGFSALLGGYRSNGSFSRLNTIGDWWTSTATNSDNAYRRFMSSTADFVDYSSDSKSSYSFSVRCIEGDDNSIYTEKGNDIANYKTKQIGTQTWMAENLDYNVAGSKCYDDDTDNCATYGRLYNWATAMALDASCNSSTCASQVSAKHRGICPAGWHIPSYAELDVLINYAGGSSAGKYLKARSGWENNGNGEDKFGFAALPGGLGYSGGDFHNGGGLGLWWSAREGSANYAYRWDMGGDDVGVVDNYKNILFSIRCIKD